MHVLVYRFVASICALGLYSLPSSWTLHAHLSVGPTACIQVDSGRVLGKIPSDKEVAESEALVAEIMGLQVCAVHFRIHNC